VTGDAKMQNSPDYFPELHHTELERYAGLWVQDYEDIPIIKVVLYHYHSSLMEKYGRRYPNMRHLLYVVSFEISGLNLSPYKTKAQIVRTKEGIAIIDPPEKMELPWRDFIDKFDNVNDHPYPKSRFIYTGFERVYLNQPSLEFHKNWLFCVSEPGELPNNVAKEPQWVLWSAEEANSQNNHVSYKQGENQQSSAKKDLPEGYIGRFEDKKDGIWEITHKGKTVHYKNSKGLKYIAMLLDRPNETIPSLTMIIDGEVRPEPTGAELRNIVEHTIPENTETHAESKNIKELSVRTEGDMMSEVKLDGDELRAIQRALQSLYDRAIVSSDERLQGQFDEMKGHYENTEGLFVKVNDDGKVKVEQRQKIIQDAEKARQSIQKAINGAYAKMGKAQNHPDLLNFLRSHIVTGTFCSYQVDEALPHKWDIDWQL
jgi:hypothetical protein